MLIKNKAITIKEITQFGYIGPIMPKIFLILTLCLFTLGCSVTGGKAPNFYKDQNTTLATKDTFKISGKIAIIDPKQKLSTYINVDVKKDTYVIYLTDITGNTVFKLTKNEEDAVLVDNEGKIHHGNDANTLVKSLTGLNLPCDDLPFILKANPLNFKHKNSEDGSLESIDYDDMHIEYQSYLQQDSYILPQNINIKGNNFTIRIKINKWEI